MITRFFRIIAQLFVICKCFLCADQQHDAQRRKTIATGDFKNRMRLRSRRRTIIPTERYTVKREENAPSAMLTGRFALHLYYISGLKRRFAVKSETHIFSTQVASTMLWAHGILSKPQWAHRSSSPFTASSPLTVSISPQPMRLS